MQIRATGDYIDTAIETGDILDEALSAASKPGAGDMASVRFYKAVSLALAARLGDLQRARQLYEQSILVSEFILRHNQQLERGLRRIANRCEAQDGEGLVAALDAVENYLRQALPMAHKLVDEFDALAERSAKAHAKAQAAANSHADMVHRLHLA